MLGNEIFSCTLGPVMSEMNVNEIKNFLPHRYPFLLVDRVLELVPGESIRAIKNVSVNEPFFNGHFPDKPIMPGVLQIEAMAQAAAILGIETLELAGTGKLVFFMGIDGAKFRSPVTPGCLLDLEVEFIQKRSRVYKFKGRASVEGKTTSECEFTAMIADPPKAD